MTEPDTGTDSTADSTTAYATAIARIEHRRGVALDLLGLAVFVGGVGCMLTVLIMQLGVIPAVLVAASVAQSAAGVLIMRRAAPVPRWLQVRAPTPDQPREPVDPLTVDGQPYAPARTPVDGAPRSPMTGR